MTRDPERAERLTQLELRVLRYLRETQTTARGALPLPLHGTEAAAARRLCDLGLAELVTQDSVGVWFRAKASQ